LYQTMIFAMIFQSLGILVSKTALEGDGIQLSEYVGQTLISIAMVYIFNGITKFTANWFNVKTRALATALILCSATLGNYTPIWIKIIYDADQQRLMAGVLTQGGEVPIFDPSIAFYKMMDTYKLVLFLMNLVLTFVIIYAFDSKPEAYPSLS